MNTWQHYLEPGRDPSPTASDRLSQPNMPELRRAATGDVRTRVEDYLNDKIQTAADLDQVDALVQRVQDQQGLLRKQV